ncbi:ketopantoate reductase family protein [Pseudomonas sp. dw_358]|uniref:ketopantoate reductase family protein n=1 Tax=Pseudomonas sp. dw_358 TaxID=2720083 RepID=UPI001BD4A26E|nr:ketopantoate reductase family protein [Pseudomonas sp. dw_358]
MSDPCEPIVIWGGGAIGASLACALVKAGEPVLLVDSAMAHVEAINRRGLTLTGPLLAGCFKVPACLPEQVPGLHRRIWLAVKSHHTEQAMVQIKPHLAADGYVASMQNGLNERVIAEHVGVERTVGAFFNFGADLIEPGVVHYGGRGAVVVGELDGQVRERTRELHGALLHFDPEAVLSENIWGYLWAKMIYGAQLFATALSDDSIADVLAMPRFRPVLTQLAREIGAVAAAEGVVLQAFNGFDPQAFAPQASQAETQRSFDEMVAHNRRSLKSHSGIWRDLAVHKRKTEIDAQIAPAVGIGASHGLDMPVTRRLIELIHAIEQGERPQSQTTLALLSLSAGEPVHDAV